MESTASCPTAPRKRDTMCLDNERVQKKQKTDEGQKNIYQLLMEERKKNAELRIVASKRLRQYNIALDNRERLALRFQTLKRNYIDLETLLEGELSEHQRTRNELFAQTRELDQLYEAMVNSVSWSTLTFKPPVKGTCIICQEETKIALVCAKGCGHEYCFECMTSMHLNGNHLGEVTKTPPSCPEPNCNTIFLQDYKTTCEYVSPSCRSFFETMSDVQGKFLSLRESHEVQMEKVAQESRIHKFYPNFIFEDVEKILNSCCPKCSQPLVLGEGCMKVLCSACETPTCLYCLFQPEGSTDEHCTECYTHIAKECFHNPFVHDESPYHCPPCIIEHVLARSKAVKIVQYLGSPGLRCHYGQKIDRLVIALRHRYCKEPHLGFVERSERFDFGSCPFDWIGFMEGRSMSVYVFKTEAQATDASPVKARTLQRPWQMMPNPLVPLSDDPDDLCEMKMSFTPYCLFRRMQFQGTHRKNEAEMKEVVMTALKQVNSEERRPDWEIEDLVQTTVQNLRSRNSRGKKRPPMSYLESALENSDEYYEYGKHYDPNSQFYVETDAYYQHKAKMIEMA